MQPWKYRVYPQLQLLQTELKLRTIVESGMSGPDYRLILPGLYAEHLYYVLADLSTEMVLIVSRGFGSVCKQHSFARVRFCVMGLCRHCKCVVLMSSLFFFVSFFILSSCRTVKETKGHGTILIFPKTNGFIVPDTVVKTIEVQIKN